MSSELLRNQEIWFEKHILEETKDEQLRVLLDRLGSCTMCFDNQEATQTPTFSEVHPCADAILGHIVKHKLWKIRWSGSDAFSLFVNYVEKVFISRYIHSDHLSDEVIKCRMWRVTILSEWHSTLPLLLSNHAALQRSVRVSTQVLGEFARLSQVNSRFEDLIPRLLKQMKSRIVRKKHTEKYLTVNDIKGVRRKDLATFVVPDTWVDDSEGAESQELKDVELENGELEGRDLDGGDLDGDNMEGNSTEGEDSEGESPSSNAEKEDSEDQPGAQQHQHICSRGYRSETLSPEITVSMQTSNYVHQHRSRSQLTTPTHPARYNTMFGDESEGEDHMPLVNRNLLGEDSVDGGEEDLASCHTLQSGTICESDYEDWRIN